MTINNEFQRIDLEKTSKEKHEAEAAFSLAAKQLCLVLHKHPTMRTDIGSAMERWVDNWKNPAADVVMLDGVLNGTIATKLRCSRELAELVVNELKDHFNFPPF